MRKTHIIYLILFPILLTSCVIKSRSALFQFPYASSIEKTTVPETPASTPTENTVKDLLPVPDNIPQAAFEPTPTQTEEINFYEFSFNGLTADISNASVKIVFTEGYFEGKEFSINTVSPDNLGDYQTTGDALKLGTGAGVIRADSYGNLFLTAHSGYLNADISKPLEAEIFRFAIEQWGEKTNEYLVENLNLITDSRGFIYIEGIPFPIKIVAGVRLWKEESDYINLHPAEVADIVTKTSDGQYVALGNPQAFETIKAENSHDLIINFCGWGPSKEPSYYRYVFYLDITEEEYTNAPEVLLNQHLGCFFIYVINLSKNQNS